MLATKLAASAAALWHLLFPWSLQIEYNVAFAPRAPAATPVTQVFLGGNAVGYGTSAGTFYSFPTATSSGAWTTVENDNQAIFLAGTISELRVVLSADVGGNGVNATFTLRKNGASTAVTCTISGSGGTQANCANDAAQTALSFTTAEADLVSMEMVLTGTATNRLVAWSYKWVGTNSNESMLISGGLSDSATGTECIDASGRNIANVACSAGNDFSRAAPAAENFTITGLYAKHDATITAGCRQITLRKNGSNDTTFQVVVTGPTVVSDLTGSVAFNTSSTPDYVMVEDDPGGTCDTDPTPQTTGNVAYTLRLIQTSQRFQATMCESDPPLNSAVEYGFPAGGNGSWNATETSRDVIAAGFTQTGFAARTTPAPENGGGAADLYDYRLRDDTNNVFGCQTAGSVGTCNASGSTAIADASLVAISSTPASTPTAPTAYCMSWSGTGS